MTKYIVVSAISFAGGLFVLGLCKVHQDTRVADGVERLASNAAAAMNVEERMAEVQARLEMVDRDQERTAERLDRYAERLGRLLEKPKVVVSGLTSKENENLCKYSARLVVDQELMNGKKIGHVVPSDCTAWYAEQMQGQAVIQ